MRDKLYLWPYEHDHLMSKEARRGIYRIDGTDPWLLVNHLGLRFREVMIIPSRTPWLANSTAPVSEMRLKF